MGKTILKLLTTWLYSNITPFSRVIVPVVLSSLIDNDICAWKNTLQKIEKNYFIISINGSVHMNLNEKFSYLFL